MAESQDNLYYAIYVEGVATNSIPSSSSGYTLDEVNSSCTNGVTITWNDSAWSASVSFSNFTGTSKRTTCTLYFEKATSNTLATTYITSLYTDDSTELAYDNTADNNLRYIGADPNNYIDIGDNVLWRIIGVFEVDDGTGNIETRLKIIRSESIGEYSWDSSESSVNNGYGINQWGETEDYEGADLMRLLNDGYDGETGGSLYWNSSSGECYNARYSATTSCDFTSTGLTTTAQSYFGDAIWYTGANDGTTYTYENILTSKFYELVRSDDNGKMCTSGTSCSDSVDRTTTWTGKIALADPSDFGYATVGGSSTSRDTCLNTVLYNWDSYSDCYENDWLYVSDSIVWLLTPLAYSSSGAYVFLISSQGFIGYRSAYRADVVFPAGYLSASVTITDGDGSESSPFVASLS